MTDSGDLAQVVHEVMATRFDWFTINDTFSLMVDLASAGVDLSMSDFVDTSEHGIQLLYAHGKDCDGCAAIQALAFDAIRGTSQ